MSTAIISDCCQYRYLLTRRIPQVIRWVKPCLFIMLNPSTADASRDDPTIRRCIGFANLWKCTELTVVNLYGLRATNPKELSQPDRDVIGPDNDRHILDQIFQHRIGVIVAAWGSHTMAARRTDIIKAIRNAGAVCLGKTKDRSPRHPLYVRSDAEPIPLEDTQ